MSAFSMCGRSIYRLQWQCVDSTISTFFFFCCRSSFTRFYFPFSYFFFHPILSLTHKYSKYSMRDLQYTRTETAHGVNFIVSVIESVSVYFFSLHLFRNFPSNIECTFVWKKARFMHSITSMLKWKPSGFRFTSHITSPTRYYCNRNEIKMKRYTWCGKRAANFIHCNQICMNYD